MQSADRDHFFETDASQAERQRKAAKSNNKNGNPLTMKSKILAAIPDPTSPLTSIFIAESAGFVRRVHLQETEPRATYRGPKAPVTCLTLGGLSSNTIFAGCWDKDIWSWDVDSTATGRTYKGHSDFVKTLLATTISGKHMLLSGGADKKIIVWDVETGQRLHTMQDPTTTMLAVQHIAIDPLPSSDGTGPDAVVLASASSDPYIRRWKVTLSGYEQLVETYADRPDMERSSIHEHETSVYKLYYDTDAEEVDLWTASADGTAKCLARAQNFVTEDTFPHGDYVRAVVVTDHWVVTAGRNEDVKVWDRATGKLYATLEGHFEEITDLVLLREESEGRPVAVCSVSIDRTIRTWPLGKVDLDETVQKIREAAKPKQVEESKEGGAEGMLTADEEAELAELMDDDG